MATENEKKLETQIKDLTQERKKLESEILALKARINSEETKSVANIEKMVKLEALRLNNYEKEEEVRKKIEKIETDGIKRSEELNSLVEDNLDYSKEQNDLTSKLSFIKKGIVNQAERIRDEQSQSAALMGVVNKEGKTVLGTAAQQKDAYASITNYLQVGAESAGATTTQTQAYVKILEQAGDTAADMLGYEDRILLAQEKAKQGIYETVDLSNLELSYKVTAAKFAQDAPNMTEAQRKSAQELLGVEGERLQVLRDANESLEKGAAKSGLLKDAMGGVNLSMSGLLEKIPSGDKIGKLMNIDKTANKMKKQFGEAAAAFNEKNFGKAFAAAGGGLKSMIGLAGKFSAALGLGLLMGAANFLIGAFNKVDEEVAEIGNEFGISRKAASELRDTSVDIAGEMGMVGINSKEVVKNIGAVSEMMGGLDIGSQLASGNPAVKQLVKDATLLTEKFGMSSDEVASMQTLSSITGKSMGELAGTAVKMGGGLMTSKQALKALAGVPKEVAVAFKGIPSALAAAAQKAKLLGHDLKKVQDIGDGMLDIEQSLEKEMEARVLTGKNLQLDKARELALNGDIAGLQDELLKQAGGLGEFTKMNRIQQKSMAEAMGMSVEEMTTMLSNADKLQKMGVSQKRLDEMQNMNAEQLRKLNQDGMNDVMKGEIEKMAKEKESAAIKERMSNIVTKLQEKLSKLLSPILEMVHGMLDATEAGGGFDEIIESISATVKGIIPIVKTVFTIMSAIQIPLSAIFGFISNIGASTVQVKDAAGNLTDKTEVVKSSFGGILSVVLAIGAAFAGKALLGKGMDMLKDKAADVGKSVLKNIGGSLSKVGGKFGKVAGKAVGKGGGAKMPKMPGAKGAKGKGGGGFMDSLVEAFNKIDAKKMIQGAAALVILSIALYITAKAVQEFMKTDWDAMAKAGVALLGLAAIAYLLSKAKSAMIEGAIAMIILGVALGIIGLALQLFTSISWEDLAKAGIALLGLAGIAALLGTFAPLFLIGAFVLGVLGVALIIFAGAMWILGKAMEGVVPLMETAFNGISTIITVVGDAIVKIINAVAGGITGIIDKLMGLAKLDGDTLWSVAKGITALGGAIAAFGAGGGIGAGLAGLGSLLGGESPIEQIVKITKELQPEKLTTAATAIVAMSAAMKQLQEALSKLDVDKMAKAIDKLNEMEVSKGAGAMLGGIGSAISSVFGGGKKEEVAAGGGGGVKVEGQQTAGVAMAGAGGGVGGGLGGGAGAAAGGGGGSMSGVEKKLDSLISIISGMSSTPTIIKIGDKTVEEINMKGDFKKAYQIGSDNTFGKAL